MATAKVRAESSPLIPEGKYDVQEVKELNFFDLSGAKAKTQGTSNKFYHAELQVEKGSSRCQVFTMYGPTGKVQAREWRYFTDTTTAKKEFDSIIKSKVKKGYTEIDVAQRALGSSEAQKIVKPVTLTNADHLKAASVSKLDGGKKQIVDIFFGAQADFVAQVLKCPLGQLTNNQIDQGRDALNQAKVIVNATKKLSKGESDQILDLTNRFYGLIPHNLGAGARGQMTELMLDTLDKIVQKELDLDTLLDAKQVNAILATNSTADNKYDSLNCDFDILDINSPLAKFIISYFAETKVHGHGFDGVRIKNIWSMKRKDAKEAAFLRNAERIAKESKGHIFAAETESLSRGKSKLWTPDKRPDLDKGQIELYNKANVWLCWHGTRSANLVGITRRGLLIRPSGAVYTGSMFGDGKYMAWQSTKSLNYCDGGYWTGGRGSNKKYMFLLDVAFGNMHKVNTSQFFKAPPRGFHSVYGKSGHSLRNDEMITYDMQDTDNQSSIRYILEIE